MRSNIIASRSGRTLLALLTLAAPIACKRQHTTASNGDIARNWTPVAGAKPYDVPTTEISAAIVTDMAAKPPVPVRKDTWEHARRLYKNYQSAPLWLKGDGLDKTRAGALLLAL